MSRNIFSAFLLVMCTVSVQSVLAQQVQTSSVQVVLSDSHQNSVVPGVLTLTKDGLSFDSKDVIFKLSITEIKKLEVQGSRKGFATFAIESKSPFVTQYSALLLRRDDAYRQFEPILVVSLAQREDLARALATLKNYQAVIQAARDEQAKAMVGQAAPTAGSIPAYPFIGKTIKVYIATRNRGILHGYLTFFESSVQFSSSEATFQVPLGIVEKVECAGARETFLTLKVSSKTEFAKLYQEYLRDSLGHSHFYGDENHLDLKLDVDEDVRQSFEVATQFQQYLNDLLAGRIRAMVAAAPTSQPSSQYQQPNQAPLVDQPQKREIFRLNAAFVEKYTPKSTINAFKLITGVRGKLVIFDSGVGYVSDEIQPHVKVSRQQYLQDNHLKFFVPSSAIDSVTDVSAIRNPYKPEINAYIAEVTVNRDSDFFKNHGTLMAESNKDNVLYLMFASQFDLRQYISSQNRAQRVDQF